MDLKSRKIGLAIENYHVVIGLDIVGDAEEVGEGVTIVSVGDQVVS